MQGEDMEFSGSPIAKDMFTLSLLALVGGFGGYLSAMRSNIYNTRDRSLFSRYEIFHMLQGVAGAIIIVTLTPVDPTIVKGLFDQPDEQLHSLVKLIALALIGGYAVGSLLESSASQFSKQIDNLTEDQKTLTEEQRMLTKRQDELEEEINKVNNLVRTAERILWGAELNANEIAAFNIAVQDSPPQGRTEIGRLADESRKQNWKHSKELLERPIIVFQALVQSFDAVSNHRWFGSLGYCLKDKIDADYSQAVSYLSKAIELRGPLSRSGGYEFNRAECNIILSNANTNESTRWSLDQQIEKDLETAARFRRFREMIEKEDLITTWKRKRLDRPTAILAGTGTTS